MRQFTYDTPLIRGATFSRTIRYATVLCQSSSQVTIQTGTAVFAVQTGLNIVIGQRVRASLAAPPIDDPTIFVEGVITAYSNGLLTLTVDTYGGTGGSVYNSWLLTGSVDLTGAMFAAVMRFSPKNCASRARTPVTLSIVVTGDPKTGVFTIYLSPSQTALLILGDYIYKVLFTPASSSDMFPLLTGTISVIDD